MKPILFNTEMVRAILDGRKTVTRRVVKPQPSYSPNDGFSWKGAAYGTDLPPTIKGAAYNFRSASPYRPGDILYVRETWCDPSGTEYPFLYKADMPMHWDAEDTEIGVPIDLRAEDYTWRPSIHMPKECARLFLRVTDVRLERLQECGKGWCLEIEKEGVETKQDPILYISDDKYHDALRAEFQNLWNSTIKKADLPHYGWDANPWVWVIEFERISKEEAQKGGER